MRRIIRRAALLLAAAVISISAGLAEEQNELLHTGDTVFFGQYDQDGNTGNGSEPIEWIVLDMSEGKALLLARYGLDTKPYHVESANVTWEQCTLRAWLNRNFLENSFSPEEQAAIRLTDVNNSAEQGFGGYNTDGGLLTQDKIFLLSWQEAERYFSGVLAKMCIPTAAAVANGAWVSSSYTVNGRSAGAWWLRSPGAAQNEAIRVGNIASRRDDVSQTRNCVRPALWFNMNRAELLRLSGQ